MNFIRRFRSIKVLVSESEKSMPLNQIFIWVINIVIHNGVCNKHRKNYNEKIINKSLKAKKVRVISVCRFVSQKI